MRPLLVIAIKLMLISGLFAQQSELAVSIGGLIYDKGKVFVAVYNSANGFPENQNATIYKGTFSVINKKCTFKLALPAGTYAIAVFFDENNNQKLDKNIVGYPKEKFGFSNNPKIVFSAPTFDQCGVVLANNEQKKIEILLR